MPKSKDAIHVSVEIPKDVYVKWNTQVPKGIRAKLLRSFMRKIVLMPVSTYLSIVNEDFEIEVENSGWRK